MTKDDAMETIADGSTTSRPILGQILFFCGISLAGGGLGAGITIGMEDGINAVMLAVTGTLIVVGSLMVAGAIKVGNFEPPSLKTRTGRAQLILLLCVILGAFLGLYANITGAADRFLDGDFSLSRTEGIVALVVLFLIGLPTGLLWQKQADEHEIAAAKDAGYIALNVYIYGYLGIIIAASAGLIPWISGPTVFMIVLFTFLVAWMVKRAG